MEFRERLIRTLRALAPVLCEEVLIVGSEVPNLLPGPPGPAIIISQDVDVGVPLAAHERVKAAVRGLPGFGRLPEEPSVLLPEGELLEVNFVGIDYRLAALEQSYVVEDPELPLLVFGSLGLLQPAARVQLDDLSLPLPELAGLALEKLLTERSGVKGERDLLVALALLARPGGVDEAQFSAGLASLPHEQRQLVRTNLSLLSLLEAHPGMPDPAPHRARVLHLLRIVEEILAK